MANNRRNANNNSNNVGVKNSWSLIAFAKAHGRMQRGEFTNSQTGDEFASCIFTNEDGEKTMVGFSANLGELSVKEIVNRKNDLQVVELESGNYKLCAQGADSWQDVDLGL